LKLPILKNQYFNRYKRVVMLQAPMREIAQTKKQPEEVLLGECRQLEQIIEQWIKQKTIDD
jgi:hypothetical protein